MTLDDLKRWHELQAQSTYADLDMAQALTNADKQELTRLNYLVMEVCHKIHNDNMLRKD